MACEQERLWELQYMQYKTGIVAIKKSKKCNKKREIFSFFKKFICFICETFAFQRAEKEPAASAICGNQARPDFGVRPGTGKRRRRIHRLRLKHMGFQAAEGLRKAFPGFSGNVREIHVSSPEGCTRTRTLARPPVCKTAQGALLSFLLFP